MKNTLATLATAATLLAATPNPANAKGTQTTLSQSDWNTIAELAEQAYIEVAEEIPVVLYELTEADWLNIEQTNVNEGLTLPAEAKEITQTTLHLSLESGTTTSVTLQAPLSDEEPIGLAIIDANGKVITSATGTFGSLKHVRIPEKRSTTYVIRAYSTTQVYETKIQVVYL